MTGEKLVFIPDKLNEDALRILEEAVALKVDYRPNLEIEEKIAAARKAHALIIRSATRVTKEFLEATECLELIVRAGVGVDNIDVEEATRRGIVVQNVPEGNIRSAAEHAIALIMALARNLPQAHRSLKDGKWERSSFAGVEVRGKTLGVVGLGKIGRHVIRMAAGLGFHVLCHDPYVSPAIAEDLKVQLVPDLVELASQVDFLSVHVPKTPATVGLIGAEIFAKARHGIRVINCARGGIVDEQALLEALENGTVAGAAIDVFAEEPPGLSPLVAHPSVIVTPHLGASTKEAQEAVALTGAQQVVDYLIHRKLHSPVNTITLEPELREEMLPYHELSVRLGRLHAQLLEGNPVRVVVRYYGELFEEQIQKYLTDSVLMGFLEDRAARPVNAVNARALAKEQGLVVEEVLEGKSRYFTNFIKVEVADEKGSREVGGALRGRKGLRLVSLDAYQFDAVLEGNLLITSNEDRPGMIGTLGNVLASNDINISNMSLGRDRTGGTALAVLNVDARCPISILEDLCSRDGILWAKAIHIDP